MNALAGDLKTWCCIVAMMLGLSHTVVAQHLRRSTHRILVESALKSDAAKVKWIHILTSRNTTRDDSVHQRANFLICNELNWYALIERRKHDWENILDSLSRPFEDISLNEVTVLVGSGGKDDAFTYEDGYLCMDLSVLAKVYGDADLAENVSRIDRLFAHEATHLLHKAWMRNRHINLRTFKDSVLWECIYEGIGTYRSLSEKWHPVGDSLPEPTRMAMSQLSPEFLVNIAKLCSGRRLTDIQKAEITANLSRGAISKKWGAFTVAIWIALYVGKNEEKLKTVVRWGVEAPVMLALKYLPETRNLSSLMPCVTK